MSEPQVSGEIFRAWSGAYNRSTVKAVKAPGGVKQVDTVHVNEETGRTCVYCMLPASDPERAYYGCLGIRKVERDRRLAAQDYKQWRARQAVEPVKMVETVTVEQVHTSIFDQDKERLKTLGPMTVYESRLAEQGGYDAVVEDRRYHARVAGDPNWKTIGEPKPTPTPEPTTGAVDVPRQTVEAELTAGRRLWAGRRINAPRPPELIEPVDGPITVEMMQVALAALPIKRGRGPDKGPRKRRRKPKQAPVRGTDGRYTSKVRGTE